MSIVGASGKAAAGGKRNGPTALLTLISTPLRLTMRAVGFAVRWGCSQHASRPPHGTSAIHKDGQPQAKSRQAFRPPGRRWPFRLWCRRGGCAEFRRARGGLRPVLVALRCAVFQTQQGRGCANKNAWPGSSPGHAPGATSHPLAMRSPG